MNKFLYKIINESPGYDMSFSLNQDELDFFREEINFQYLLTIKNNYPALFDKFKKSKICDYHHYSNLLDHEKLWKKERRCLSQQFVKKIKKMNFYNNLRNELGEFTISDITFDDKVVTGQEEAYWRIVRPGFISDVGPLHADKWFHEILSFSEKNVLKNNSVSLKMWVAIYCELGKNGLLVVPDSNKKKLKYEIMQKNGYPKPVLIDNVDPILLNTNPGDVILFGDSLIHTGAVNNGNSTRVSVEITMIFDDD